MQPAPVTLARRGPLLGSGHRPWAQPRTGLAAGPTPTGRRTVGDGGRGSAVCTRSPSTARISTAPTAFYRDVLGAPARRAFDPPGLAFFDLGRRACCSKAGAPPAMLYLGVRRHRRGRAPVSAMRAPWSTRSRTSSTPDAGGRFGPKGNEEWMAFFRDSEGNLLGSSSSASPVRPGPRAQ